MIWKIEENLLLLCPSRFRFSTKSELVLALDYCIFSFSKIPSRYGKITFVFIFNRFHCPIWVLFEIEVNAWIYGCMSQEISNSFVFSFCFLRAKKRRRKNTINLIWFTKSLLSRARAHTTLKISLSSSSSSSFLILLIFVFPRQKTLTKNMQLYYSPSFSLPIDGSSTIRLFNYPFFFPSLSLSRVLFSSSCFFFCFASMKYIDYCQSMHEHRGMSFLISRVSSRIDWEAESTSFIALSIWFDFQRWLNIVNE